MRFQGCLSQWDDARGFGFITPNGGGERVFLHIRALPRSSARPVEGMLLTYQLGRDAQGRPRAIEARRVGEAAAPAPAGDGRAAPVFAGLFCAALLALTLAGRLPWQLAAGCAGLSLASFIAYWLDKQSAQRGAWRTPESTLHLLALAGGWPGALAAQRLVRHKNAKPEFQAVFWLTVLLNCAGLLWLLMPPGHAFLRSLGV